MFNNFMYGFGGTQYSNDYMDTLQMAANLARNFRGSNVRIESLPYTDYDPQSPRNYRSNMGVDVGMYTTICDKEEYVRLQMILMDESVGKYKFRFLFAPMENAIETGQFNARHPMPLKRFPDGDSYDIYNTRYCYGFDFERSNIYMHSTKEIADGFSTLFSYFGKNASEFRRMGL